MKLRKSIYYKNKKNLCLLVLVNFMYAGSNILLAFVIQKLVDSIANQNSEAIKSSLIFGVITTMFISLSLIFMRYADHVFIKNAAKQYKDTVIKRFLYKRSSISEADSNIYLSALTNDFAFIEQNYISGIGNIASTMFLLVLSSIAMMYFNMFLFLITILFCGISITISIVSANNISKIETAVSTANTHYLSKVKESISSFLTIKGYGIQVEFYQSNKELNEKVETIKKKKRDKLVTVHSVNMLLTNGITVALLGFGGILAMNGQISIGSIIGFTQLLTYFFNPINQIGPLLSGIKASTALINKLENEINDKENITEENKDFNFVNDINLRNVNFSYDERLIIKNLNFKFEKNLCYALVGTSGSGKSSIIKLITREISPSSGDVLIDCVNVASINEKAFFDNVNYLAQRPIIFNLSLYDNITMFQKYTKSEINEVLTKVHLDDLVKEKGIYFLCGENGSNLSGGEKQKVVLARSLLKQSEILLADEITSALDSNSTFLVEEILTSINTATRIIVTHKLNKGFLKKCDQILVIDQGEILEQGKFEDLIDFEGLFYSLYNEDSATK